MTTGQITASNPADVDACRAQLAIIQAALDGAGERLAAVHIQMAIDILQSGRMLSNS